MVTTYAVLYACTAVMRTLGTGYSESVYQNALSVHLTKLRVPHRCEVLCPIYYMGSCVGYGKADVVTDDCVVELKANSNQLHKSVGQLNRYLKSLSVARPYQGILVNFNQATGKLEYLLEPAVPLAALPPWDKVK